MKEGSIVGALPASLLNEVANRFGFATIVQHTCSRLTTSSYQTSTKNIYIIWYYDTVANEVTNQNDTRMVVNKGLTTNRDKNHRLKPRGSNDTSLLLDCVDS